MVAATLTDHIVPHKGDMKLFWDSANHQSLCHDCHSFKTAREDGGFGRLVQSQGEGRVKSFRPLAAQTVYQLHFCVHKMRSF